MPWRRLAGRVALVALLAVPLAGAAAAGHPVRAHVNDNARLVVGPRLQAAAHRGNARAQAMLGYAYAIGHGVPQDYRVAVMWYRRAARQSNAVAQYLLGLMYDRGQGVRENTILAQKWLILATAGASRNERNYFARIRDAVASKMSEREILRAQALAQAWSRKHRR